MTTPWVGRPRWTCKYCNVTINDDVPSRTHHESGLRHKHNVERSLRDAYKKSQRERADEAHARQLMKQIERSAGERHARDEAEQAGETPKTAAAPADDIDVESSSAEPSSTGTAKAQQQQQQRPKKWQPVDRLEAYGSALPVVGTGEEALADAQKEDDVEELQQGKQGVIGDWQVVQQPPPIKSRAITHTNAQESQDKPTPSSFRFGEKQGRYDHHDEYDDHGTSDEFDKIKVKKRMRPANEQERQRTMLPTWTSMRLDTGVGVKQEGVQAVPVQRIAKEQSNVTMDEDAPGVANSDEANAATTAASTTSSSNDANPMFKKRKTGAGAGAKKVRAVI